MAPAVSELLGTFFLVLVAAGGGILVGEGQIVLAAAVVAPGLMVMAIILPVRLAVCGCRGPIPSRSVLPAPRRRPTSPSINLLERATAMPLGGQPRPEEPLEELAQRLLDELRARVPPTV